MINIREIYLKYKSKYLNLKNELYGGKLQKTCIKLKDKKYLDRPSPPYHANDCKNKILEGNDGNEYFSRADKNGIYKWKLVKSMEECKTAKEYYSQFYTS